MNEDRKLSAQLRLVFLLGRISPHIPQDVRKSRIMKLVRVMMNLTLKEENYCSSIYDSMIRQSVPDVDCSDFAVELETICKEMRERKRQ